MAGSSSNEAKPVEDPPAYATATIPPHPGPIPSGKYWIGHPDEKHRHINETPSAAALSVSARRPLQGMASASVHLSAIGDGPWPNQIWTVNQTRHAYTLRNEATRLA